jgi:hypothetical protein
MDIQNNVSHQRPLSIMYNILWLLNTNLRTADTILLCMKYLYVIHDSHSPFRRKIYICLLVRCPLCPIWPPALPLNPAYIFIYFRNCHDRNCPIQISYIPRTKTDDHFLYFRLFIRRILAGPKRLVFFRNTFIFYGEDMLAPRPTPKLECHSLSAVRNCLFSTFANTLHILGPSPSSATWGRTMPWRQKIRTWYINPQVS